jgi:hypothetical protein
VLAICKCIFNAVAQDETRLSTRKRAFTILLPAKQNRCLSATTPVHPLRSCNTNNTKQCINEYSRIGYTHQPTLTKTIQHGVSNLGNKWARTNCLESNRCQTKRTRTSDWSRCFSFLRRLNTRGNVVGQQARDTIGAGSAELRGNTRGHREREGASTLAANANESVLFQRFDRGYGEGAFVTRSAATINRLA